MGTHGDTCINTYLHEHMHAYKKGANINVDRDAGVNTYTKIATPTHLVHYSMLLKYEDPVATESEGRAVAVH